MALNLVKNGKNVKINKVLSNGNFYRVVLKFLLSRKTCEPEFQARSNFWALQNVGAMKHAKTLNKLIFFDLLNLNFYF